MRTLILGLTAWGIAAAGMALTNGSFEDGLKGWRMGKGAEQFSSVCTNEGGHSLVIASDDAQREVCLSSARIPVPSPDLPAFVEFSYKVDAGCSPSDIRLTLEYFDAQGKVMSLKGSNRGAKSPARATYIIPADPFIFDEVKQGAWTRRTYLVPAAVEKPSRMALQFTVAGNAGLHWVDDVVVRPAPAEFDRDPDRLLWCVPYRRGVGAGPSDLLVELQKQKSPFLDTAAAYHRCLSLLGRVQERLEHLRRAAIYSGKDDGFRYAATNVAATAGQADAFYKEYGLAFLGTNPQKLPDLNVKLAGLEKDLQRLYADTGKQIVRLAGERKAVSEPSEPPQDDVKPVISPDGSIDRCVFTSWAKEYHLEALMPFGDLGQFLSPRDAESPQKDRARYLFQVLPFYGVNGVFEDVVRPDFYKKHKDDPSCLREFTTSYTNATPRKGRIYPNFLNPEVRQEVAACAEDTARAGRVGDKGMIMVMSWEDRGPYSMVMVDGEEIIALPGYDRGSQEEFRNYLRRSYKTIEALNREIGTAFTNFDSIAAPPIDLRKITRPNPLHYVFVKWLHQQYVALRVEIYQALKKGNPKGVVMCDHSYWFGLLGFDPLSLFEGCDLLGMHNARTGLMVQSMMASLKRYKNRTLACFEEHGHGDMKAVDEQSKLDQKLATLGRFLNLRHEMFELGQSYSTGAHSISYGSSYWANPTYDCSIFRYHTVGIPVGIDRVRDLETAMRSTQEAPIPVALMVPETSFYWQQPHGATLREMNDTFKLLYPLGYRFGFEPEQMLVDGKVDLGAYQVLLMPQAPHFRRGLWPRLEAWVRNGGTLVAIGPCGVFDEYGRTYSADESLTVRFEGKGGTNDSELNTSWDDDIAGTWGGDKIRVHAVGKGRYVAVPHSMKKTGETPALRTDFLAFLKNVTLPVRSPDTPAELTLRKDTAGGTYVFALNPRSGRILEGTIELEGKFASASDLGVAGGFPVPVRLDPAANRTALRFTLGPGAWTLYRLEK